MQTRQKASREFFWKAAVIGLSVTLAPTGCGQSPRQGLPHPDKIVLAAPVAVPMELAGGLPVVTAGINGSGPYKLILDSGAAGSVFSNELLRELGLPVLGRANLAREGSADKQPATLTKIERIDVAGLRLEGVSAVCADLALVRQRVSPDIQGVLSATMLDDLLVAYDYPAGKIEFRRGMLPAADGQSVFEWPAGERLPSAMLDLSGQKIRLDLDTGSRSGFTIPQTLTTKLEWLEAPVTDGAIHTLDTITPATTGRMKGEIRLGKFTFKNPQVRSNDGVMKTIGYEVLKDFVLTLDPLHRRFELRRKSAALPPHGGE